MPNPPHKWLHRYAVLTAAATLCLLGVGGLVTSHEAGMAVPDWPTTYGYNMFLFPISQWTGGILYEHSHRLVASAVGFLTIGLALWLWRADSRAWMRRLGWIALAAVILQGVLGGLRVTQMKQELGIFHATLAQMFFVLVSAIAFFTSGAWTRLNESATQFAGAISVRRSAMIATGFIFLQLILGASMRHQHAGLAVPDFPLAYGKLWPATDAASIDHINQQRIDARDFSLITRAQIEMHMTHRLLALLILIAVGGVAVQAHGRASAGSLPKQISRAASLWFGLILLQATLGAVTVLSNKAADIATAHVLVGALSLMTGTLLCIVLTRLVHAPHPHDTRATAQRAGLATA